MTESLRHSKKIDGGPDFSELYPKGKYSEIPLLDIPDGLREKVEERAFRFSYKEDKSKPVTYFKVEIQDGSKVFGAKYDNERSKLEYEGNTLVSKPGSSDPAFYFFEMNDHNEEIGRGGVMCLQPKRTPIVDYVESYKPRIGIGKERYYLMSALSRKFFGKNLVSSLAISPEAQRIWERLYTEGETEIAETQHIEDEDGAEKTVHRYRLLFPK